MKQFIAESLLHFLTKFVKTYSRCYQVTPILTVDKVSGNMYLADPTCPSYLEMQSTLNKSAWEITSNPIMTERIMNKPELKELSQGFIRMIS